MLGLQPTATTNMHTILHSCLEAAVHCHAVGDARKYFHWIKLIPQNIKSYVMKSAPLCCPIRIHTSFSHEALPFSVPFPRTTPCYAMFHAPCRNALREALDALDGLRWSNSPSIIGNLHQPRVDIVNMYEVARGQIRIGCNNRGDRQNIICKHC
jgi:hypothetical protein